MWTSLAWILGAVSWIGPLESGAADGNYVVRLADGREVSTAEITLDPDRVRWTGASVEEVSLDEVVEIEFRGAAARSEVESGACVVLHDGSFVLGRVAGGDDLDLQFELALGPWIPLNVDAVRAVFLGRRAAFRDPRRYPARDGKDILFRRRGDSRADFTTGTFLAFGAEKFEFEYSLGEGNFPLEEIEALVLSQQVEAPSFEGRAVAVDLWPDGSLRGAFTGLDGNHLSLRPLFSEEPVRIPRSSVRGVRPLGGDSVWLSDLTPASSVETPFVGGDDLFLYPLRVDRTVTGRPLQVLGQRFPKGLGCHSRSSVTYDLVGAGGFAWFRADVGVSDEVLELADRGAVDFAVLVDGEEVLRTPTMRGGEAARRIGPIDVEGASTLTLLADFAEGEDVADRAVWGRPLLGR